MFQITFLEYFEALIGCAVVSYIEEPSTQGMKPIEILNSNESEKENLPESIVEGNLDKRLSNTSRQVTSPLKSNIDSNLDSTKKELKRGKFSTI